MKTRHIKIKPAPFTGTRSRVTGITVSPDGVIREVRVQINPDTPAYRVTTHTDDVVAALVK